MAGLVNATVFPLISLPETDDLGALSRKMSSFVVDRASYQRVMFLALEAVTPSRRRRAPRAHLRWLRVAGVNPTGDGPGGYSRSRRPCVEREARADLLHGWPLSQPPGDGGATSGSNRGALRHDRQLAAATRGSGRRSAPTGDPEPVPACRRHYNQRICHPTVRSLVRRSISRTLSPAQSSPATAAPPR